MSTSLQEVIEGGGFDLTTREGALWIQGVESEFKTLLDEAEATIERLDEEALENCEHDDTDIETVENTEEYEYGQATGNPVGLKSIEIEVCNFCGKQRTLPEGDWENV